MPKKALKKGISELQNGNCDLTGAPLPEDTALFDTDRRRPKAKGGIYLVENTRVVEPRAHMKRHGNLRVIPEHLVALKEIIDDREQVRKLAMKVENQKLAYSRGVDSLSAVTLTFLETQSAVFQSELTKRDNALTKEVKKVAKVDRLAAAALKVKGIGPVTVSHCLVYIDLAGKKPELDEKGFPKFEKDGTPILTDTDLARHASSLWKYVGLDKASHERYEKGTAGGGNKSLRTVLYTMATAQIKVNGAYRGVYDQVKGRLEASEKITKSRNTQGQLVECRWCDTKPCHRHGAALRAIMKHFLADYWFVGRTFLGLETSALYPEAILGGSHRTIMPVERGWVY